MRNSPINWCSRSFIGSFYICIREIEIDMSAALEVVDRKMHWSLVLNASVWWYGFGARMVIQARTPQLWERDLVKFCYNISGLFIDMLICIMIFRVRGYGKLCTIVFLHSKNHCLITTLNVERLYIKFKLKMNWPKSINQWKKFKFNLN